MNGGNELTNDDDFRILSAKVLMGKIPLTQDFMNELLRFNPNRYYVDFFLGLFELFRRCNWQLDVELLVRVLTYIETPTKDGVVLFGPGTYFKFSLWLERVISELELDRNESVFYQLLTTPVNRLPNRLVVSTWAPPILSQFWGSPAARLPCLLVERLFSRSLEDVEELVQNPDSMREIRAMFLNYYPHMKNLRGGCRIDPASRQWVPWLSDVLDQGLDWPLLKSLISFLGLPKESMDFYFDSDFYATLETQWSARTEDGPFVVTCIARLMQKLALLPDGRARLLDLKKRQPSSVDTQVRAAIAVLSIVGDVDPLVETIRSSTNEIRSTISVLLKRFSVCSREPELRICDEDEILVRDLISFDSKNPRDGNYGQKWVDFFVTLPGTLAKGWNSRLSQFLLLESISLGPSTIDSHLIFVAKVFRIMAANHGKLKPLTLNEIYLVYQQYEDRLPGVLIWFSERIRTIPSDALRRKPEIWSGIRQLVLDHYNTNGLQIIGARFHGLPNVWGSNDAISDLAREKIYVAPLLFGRILGALEARIRLGKVSEAELRFGFLVLKGQLDRQVNPPDYEADINRPDYVSNFVHAVLESPKNLAFVVYEELKILLEDELFSGYWIAWKAFFSDAGPHSPDLKILSNLFYSLDHGKPLPETYKKLGLSEQEALLRAIEIVWKFIHPGDDERLTTNLAGLQKIGITPGDQINKILESKAQFLDFWCDPDWEVPFEFEAHLRSFLANPPEVHNRIKKCFKVKLMLRFLELKRVPNLDTLSQLFDLYTSEISQHNSVLKFWSDEVATLWEGAAAYLGEHAQLFRNLYLEFHDSTESGWVKGERYKALFENNQFMVQNFSFPLSTLLVARAVVCRSQGGFNVPNDAMAREITLKLCQQYLRDLQDPHPDLRSYQLTYLKGIQKSKKLFPPTFFLLTHMSWLAELTSQGNFLVEWSAWQAPIELDLFIDFRRNCELLGPRPSKEALEDLEKFGESFSPKDTLGLQRAAYLALFLRFQSSWDSDWVQEMLRETPRLERFRSIVIGVWEHLEITKTPPFWANYGEAKATLVQKLLISTEKTEIQNNAIQLFAQLFVHEMKNGMKGLIQSIKSSSPKALEQARDLGVKVDYFSRHLDSSSDPERVPVTVNEISQIILNSPVRLSVNEDLRNAEISVKMGREDLGVKSILTNRYILSLAIQNLLDNAVKAVPDTIVPCISVDFCVIEDRLEVSFSDNGDEIPEGVARFLEDDWPQFHRPKDLSGRGLWVTKTILQLVSAQLLLRRNPKRFVLVFDLQEESNAYSRG